MIFLAFVVAFLWAIAAEFELKALESNSPTTILFYVFFIAWLILAAGNLLGGVSMKLKRADLKYYILIAILGFICAYVILFKLIQNYNVSLILALTNSTALISLLIRLITKQASLNALNASGVVMSVISSALLVG